ncbi:MAG: TIGR03086 family metal-binding protein, partial [Candidatus Nanopelagicales bacterium]
PCPDFQVADLVNHLAGWANSFAAKSTGDESPTDPNKYQAGDSPAAEFRESAQTIVDSYRKPDGSSDQPPIGLLLMEFLTHGWDLAVATDQPVNFSTEAADVALANGQQMLQPEYRGDGKSFGQMEPIPDTAGSVDKLVAFLGRSPSWNANA